VGSKNRDIDDSGSKDLNTNSIQEKFKSIEGRLHDIYSFYNKF